MDSEARAAAVEYLRRKGTEAPVSKLIAGLRSAAQRFEQTIEGVPEELRSRRPSAAAWSVHEIVDHLVESNRPAVAELRQLCQGTSPGGGPIPAHLTSPDARQRPWPDLVAELKRINAELIAIVAAASDTTPLEARAASVIVVKVPGEPKPAVLEWVERLDWKAYTQALRIHMHEHTAQVERTVSAVSQSEELA